MSPPREIELEAGTLRRREDGIIEIVLAKDLVMTVERAQALNAALLELADRPTPVLTDIRGVRKAGIPTMRYAAGRDASGRATRLAMLMGSPVSRMIGSVFLGMWKPPYPTRLFTDEDAAVTWLLAGSAEDTADDQYAKRRVDDEPAA